MIGKTAFPRPVKRLGQNFLVRPELASRIAGFAGLCERDTVVEIGGGTGVLTRELALNAGRVVVHEIDRRLTPLLRQKFSASRNVEIIEGDFLETAPPLLEKLPRFKVVSNPPYYITTPLIFLLLDYMPALETMVLTVQREIARRLAASPGGRDYGALTLAAGVFAEVEIVLSLGKGAFRPPPEVDSAVVRFRPQPGAVMKAEARKILPALAGKVFQQRRKTIENGLISALGISRAEAAAILSRSEIDVRARPETISPGEFLRLAQVISDYQR